MGMVPATDGGVSFAFTCEICGEELDVRSCAAVCPNCGFTLDCSDLNALPPDRQAGIPTASAAGEEIAPGAAVPGGSEPEPIPRNLADWQSK